MNTLKRADLSELKHLIDLGFSLLWVKERSKVPIENAWTKLKTKDYEELIAQGRPKYNVGVRPGVWSQLKDGTYLIVIDCDVKSDKPVYMRELMQALEDGLGLPVSCRVNSGRKNGSFHLYVRSKVPVQGFDLARSKTLVRVLMPSAKNINKYEQANLTQKELASGWRMRAAWEISVLSTGRFAVLPRSIHPDSGEAYEWEKFPKRLEDIPLVEFKAKDSSELVREVGSFQFEFKDVDLMDVKITEETIQLIEAMVGLEERYGGDRSRAVMAAIMALVRAGLTDNEIISVLLDDRNDISECPMSRGHGDVQRAARWLKPQVIKARETCASLADFGPEYNSKDYELSEAASVKQEKALVNWENELARNPQGNVKASLENTVLILKHTFEEGDGPVMRFNRFTNRAVFLRQPSWFKNFDIVSKEPTDAVVHRFMLYLSQNYFEAKEHHCHIAFNIVAGENSYHPVESYLRSLEWDGVHRCHRLFLDYIKCDGPQAYLEKVGEILLTAAATRILEPGCKYDHMVILEGKQGIGKSSCIRILAGEWFTDSLGPVDSKDYINNLFGKWFVEIGELSNFSRAEDNQFKEFMTRQVDRARLAFARNAEDYPRQCVFIGTTNNSDYLRDPTGNRRYLPVRVVSVDFKRLVQDRDQLFAEARVNNLCSTPLWIDDEKIAMIAKEEQEARQVEDPRVEQLRTALLKVKKFKERYTINEIQDILKPSMAGEFDRTFTSYEAKLLGVALRKLGWEKQRGRGKKERHMYWYPPSGHSWPLTGHSENESEWPENAEEFDVFN